MKNLKHYKIGKNRLKSIKGGFGGANKYSCTVKTPGYEDYSWTCFAPEASQCTNPIGLGKQTCTETASIAGF
ncbi:hypothetical protein [Spongiimicrobium salis]|uniref:hypothetical protein n=1 Tax=Spongiimicrobium salis TaxID=1667022 RepID=UPI00374DD7FA